LWPISTLRVLLLRIVLLVIKVKLRADCKVNLCFVFTVHLIANFYVFFNSVKKFWIEVPNFHNVLLNRNHDFSVVYLIAQTLFWLCYTSVQYFEWVCRQLTVYITLIEHFNAKEMMMLSKLVKEFWIVLCMCVRAREKKRVREMSSSFSKCSLGRCRVTFLPKVLHIFLFTSFSQLFVFHFYMFNATEKR